jgi:hypothetical protein
VSDLVPILIFALVTNIKTGVATLTALKGKYGMFVGGFLLGILWIVAAIRLAMPDSVWARTFYGPDKLGESVRRFPIVPGRPWPYPAPPAVVPTQITRGVLLAIAAGLAGIVAVLNLAVVLVGPLLPFAALARRGVRWARTTTVAMVAVMAFSGVALAALIAPEPDPVYVIATGLQWLLMVGAWHQLYRGEAPRYFHRVMSSLRV